MSKYQWVYASQPPEAVDRLARELEVSPLLARLLLNRGVNSADEGHAFLNPGKEKLHPPLMLGEMPKAVDRIRRALSERKHIRIHGDYDIDGTTSAVLLARFFRMLGANHSLTIPDRVDGYGLSHAAVARASQDGVKVLITVDNGIAAVDEVQSAQASGIDVIIADHHQFAQTLAPAYATLHPGLAGFPYPCRDLCGCGVTLKLVLALAESLGKASFGAALTPFLRDGLALGALAAIGDVVPLRGENRIIVYHGLQALRTSTHPGIRALLEVSGVREDVTTRDVAFKIGPRLNAAGRMGQAHLAADTLLCEDPAQALELARRLDALNSERQGVERGVVRSARERWSEDKRYAEDNIIVLADRAWPHGVVGVVAARMVDAFDRPAVILAIGEDGMARGSARSTRNFHLLDALKECASALERFGGHAYAAGLSVAEHRIEELRLMLNHNARTSAARLDARPVLAIDAAVTADELDLRLAKLMAQLEPFGEGNPEPLLALARAKVIGRPRLLGKTSRHLSFQLAAASGPSFRVIGFSMADRFTTVNEAVLLDAAFTPRLSHWHGSPQIELELKDLVPA